MGDWRSPLATGKTSFQWAGPATHWRSLNWWQCPASYERKLCLNCSCLHLLKSERVHQKNTDQNIQLLLLHHIATAVLRTPLSTLHGVSHCIWPLNKATCSRQIFNYLQLRLNYAQDILTNAHSNQASCIQQALCPNRFFTCHFCLTPCLITCLRITSYLSEIPALKVFLYLSHWLQKTREHIFYWLCWMRWGDVKKGKKAEWCMGSPGAWWQCL